MDGHTIKYKTNFFKPAVAINISEITAIKIDFTDVLVTTKEGKTHQIVIGSAKHSDIGRIKSKLQEIQF